MSSPLPDAVPLSEVRRVLVSKLRHHGDVLLASPVFSTLSRAAPAAEIDALVYAETAPMLAHHPAITQLHTIDRGWKKLGVIAQSRAEWALLRRLRQRRYDLLIHLTEHPRGLTLSRLLGPRWAVTREREKHVRLWRAHFTHFYRLPKVTQRHAVEANLDALRRIGVYPDPADKRLVLRPGADATNRIRALLAQHSLAPQRFIQVHPGSRWLFKCWPAERTAALIERIVADGTAVVVTGAPDERERSLVKAVLAHAKSASGASVVDLSGQLTLPELAALTGAARAFVGVDSAPMHIAAAMGTPTVALFGPSGEHVWGPWQVPQRVIVSDAYRCRPCGIDGCGGGKVSECLTTLPVAQVHAALTSLLAETAVPRTSCA
ncbi:MAG: putative lipopolysaccharide heptosyltransferase III [Betaproteobacteria bacterium]|nr:putative lipopolysaccharide heptosyltransferase III [Betaproteobacteria bacterium]